MAYSSESSKAGIMGIEQKYSPIILHLFAAGKFYMEDTFKDKMAVGGNIPIHEFRIFIRHIDSRNRCYQIASKPNGRSYIVEGSCEGTIWHNMNGSVLFDDKDNLGETIVKRNGLIVREYPTFENFWNDIKRD